jgi:membrane protein required for colicin V production
VAIFLACLILLSILTRLVAGRVKDSALGALDRSLGLVFGVARGAVIVVLAWLVMAWALPEPSERPDYIQDAKSRRLVEAGASIAARLLPGDVGTQARTATGGGASAAPAPNGGGDDRTSTGTQGSDVERWSQPKAEAEAPEEKDGYDKDVRKELDSLIESTTN